MFAVPINFLAVLACGVAAMILGFLWYGPFFGKPWMAITGMTKESMTPEKKKRMGRNYGLMFLGSIVMAFVLRHDLVFGMNYLGLSGSGAGLQAGFWNWLGFVAPVTLGKVLWDGKPWKLWFIESGYYLALLCIMGLILAYWPPAPIGIPG